jgi:hypothetical protein
MASHLHSAVGEILRYWDSELILPAKLFFEDEPGRRIDYLCDAGHTPMADHTVT